MSFDHAKLVEELIEDEGLRKKAYRDSKGILSIGIGRNLAHRGLSEEECFYLCHNDIRDCSIDLDRALPWWRDMDGVRQRVLLNLCFNLGLPKLLKFKNTLAAMEAGDYAAAAKGMAASKWAKIDVQPSRSGRMIRQMETGED